MAKTLDRSQPYGTVMGDDQGRAYEQDGVFFLATGELWQAPPEAEADKPAPVGGSAKRNRPAAAAETPAGDDQLAAQMGQT